MNEVLALVFCFLIGLCVGSFLNVCAFRIPRDIGIASPRSFCPACGADIPWYLNLPVLSWLWLRGRAACCGARFSARYPVVELAVGLLFAALFHRFGLPLAPVYWVLVSLLVLGMCTDFDWLLIPDRVTLGGAAAGTVFSVVFPHLHGTSDWAEALNRALLGGLVPALLLLAVAKVGTWLLKKDAMGLGDVKLMGCIGAFLGWKAGLFSIALGSILGSAAGLVWLAVQKREKFGSGVAIPFGPPLMAAAVVWLFGGQEWWDAAFAGYDGVLDVLRGIGGQPQMPDGLPLPPVGQEP